MSASQVIEEIRHLPPADQAEVIQFAFELARTRPLTANELAGATHGRHRRSRHGRTFKDQPRPWILRQLTMPRVRRQNLPPRLLEHPLDRIRDRNVSADQLGLLAEWLDAAPEVPDGRWFKKFSGMTV